MSLRLANPAPAFGRPAIDRTKSLSFRLDGVEIAGFEGDTILSAVLAAGILGAGRVDGAPLHLGTHFAPPVRSAADPPGAGVPMALCPARDGLDLITIGGRGGRLIEFAARLDRRPPTRLGVRYARICEQEPAPEAIPTETDLVVVGGGVAGMAAALEGARRGARVVLIEERGRLGGDAALFGNREGEPPVLETIARLTGEIAARPEIDLRLLCRADDAELGAVTFARVTADQSGVTHRRERIAAGRIVLATGCADRLAGFPGNRLPGVFGLAEAFELAGAYHVWPRGPSLFAGGVNALYHLAILAKDSGVDIARLVDHRPSPRSRFADFAKASGIPQEFGTRVAEAIEAGRERLTVSTSLAWYDNRSEGNAVFAAGSVIQTDGWQPRLLLWTRLGGRLGWNGQNGVAEGDLCANGIVLAGSVTGLTTTTGSIASGERAVAALYGDKTESIEEDRLDEFVESADAPPVRTLLSAQQSSFTGKGRVLLALPASAGKAGTRRGRSVAVRHDLGNIGELDIDSLSVLTRAGLTPANRFEAIAAERLVRSETVAATNGPDTTKAEPPTEIPGYLAGRFGRDAAEAILVSEDGRSFEPGMLVFPDSARHRPEEAVGVVLCARADGGKALLARSVPGTMTRVGVGEAGRVIAARLLEEATDGD